MAEYKLKDFKYGSLNDIEKPMVSKRIDLQNDTAVNVFKNLTKNLYTPNATLGTGPYKGIVLRIEGASKSNSLSLLGSWARLFSSGIVQIKVRIPEIHAMLPIPKMLGSNSHDAAIIEMYPTFIAQSTDVPVPEEGSLVWVDFGNKTNFTDPIYIKPCETKVGKGNISESSGGKKAFNSNCAGVFLSNKPSGDILAGKNKPLSHAGLPLYPRNTSRSVSEEYSFLKGPRFAAVMLDKWEKSIRAKGIPGQTWFGGLLSNGIEDEDNDSGKRDTLIFVPNTTDFTAPVEIMYFFHGLNEFGDEHDFADRFSVGVKKMSEERRNFVLVVPELPWSYRSKKAKEKSKSELAWTNKDNLSNFHNEILTILQESFSNFINIGFISITANGSGGSALKNAALYGGLDTIKPNKIVFAEASYLDYAETVWEKYASKDSNVEFDMLVSAAGAANRRAKELKNKTSSNSNVSLEVMVGKTSQQIGDEGLVYINALQKKEIEGKTKEVLNKTSQVVKEEDIIEPIPEDVAEQQEKDFSLREPSQPNSKIPMPGNAKVSPSAIPKKSSTPKAKEAVIKEAALFQEARVRVDEYGTLNKELLVPVPSINGKTCLLHKLAANRLIALNEAWVRDNPGVPEILIASGFRSHKSPYWNNKEEYNNFLIKKYGSVSEGRKWVAFDSPHETGLAMDIGNNGLTPVPATNKQQKNTRLYNWLVNNAHIYGFTPYKLEAWHWECRLPKESWATGEEFTEDFAVRVEDIGGSDSHMPTINKDGTVKPCITQVGEKKNLPAPKGNYKPTSSPELQLTWNDFAKGKPPKVDHLLDMGRNTEQKWGELIKKHIGFAPYGMICVRIGHESRGNPRCGPTNCCGESGLLQVWCGKNWKKGQGPMTKLGLDCQRRLPEFDPFNPSHNLWCGLGDVNVRSYRLKNSGIGKLFPVSDYQFWGCVMIGMNIGEGAMGRLLNISNAREGQAFTDMVEFVTQIGPDLQQYQSAFGSQTAESVARRVLIMPYWIKAAEQIGDMTTEGFGYVKNGKYIE